MNDGKVQTDWDRFPFTLKIVVVLGLPFQQTNDDYGDDDDDDDTGKTTEKKEGWKYKLQSVCSSSLRTILRSYFMRKKRPFVSQID